MADLQACVCNPGACPPGMARDGQALENKRPGTFFQPPVVTGFVQAVPASAAHGLQRTDPV